MIKITLLIFCTGYLMYALTSYQLACEGALDALDFRMYTLESNLIEMDKEYMKHGK